MPPETATASTARAASAPSAPHVKIEGSYRSAIALPEELLTQCTEKARESGQKLEQWIEGKLRRTLSYDAKRPLYFDDAQREQLEHVLGGTTLNNADDALRLLIHRYTLAVADEKGITVEEGAYTVLKERAAELSIPLPDMIRQAVADGLSFAAWGQPQGGFTQ